jgi:hypothetical protein
MLGFVWIMGQETAIAGIYIKNIGLKNINSVTQFPERVHQ